MLAIKSTRPLIASLVAAAMLGASTTAMADTLRAATHADLKTLDPIWTTAYITRSHGYLVYDTLFAMDENFEPQPQMVDTWDVSADGLTWTFRLRKGLEWHDGKPVTAADCVASLERWGARDGMGQALFDRVGSLTAADPGTIVMQLSEPYADVLVSLAKMSSNVPFMMPERIARTDPNKPISSPIGSGPFKFKMDEWERGKRVVYVRNDDYRPRAEPTSLGAGAKLAKVDRIEWVNFSDQEAAVQALLQGDVDYLESPATDLVPMLKDKEGVTVSFTDPLGNIGMAVFNQKVPPFDLVGVRRAALMAMDQTQYMQAALGDPIFWRTCYSVYPCDTTYATETGSKVMQTANLEAAKKALRTSGYEGTTVIILNPTDSPVISAFTKVTAERLRAIGMNVEVEDMTWARLLERRAMKYPSDEGRWSMFHTWWIAADLMDPTRIAFSGDPLTGWYGWPLDRELEALRSEFASAATAEERMAIAQKVQEHIWDGALFGVLGQFYEPIAFRNNVTGIQSPIQMYYNLGLTN